MRSLILNFSSFLTLKWRSVEVNMLEDIHLDNDRVRSQTWSNSFQSSVPSIGFYCSLPPPCPYIYSLLSHLDVSVCSQGLWKAKSSSLLRGLRVPWCFKNNASLMNKCCESPGLTWSLWKCFGWWRIQKGLCNG